MMKTAQRMADLCQATSGQAEAVVYPDMGHALGMWGRKERFDLLARAMTFIGESCSR